MAQKLTTLQKALIDPKYLSRFGARRAKRIDQERSRGPVPKQSKVR